VRRPALTIGAINGWKDLPFQKAIAPFSSVTIKPSGKGRDGFLCKSGRTFPRVGKPSKSSQALAPMMNKTNFLHMDGQDLAQSARASHGATSEHGGEITFQSSLVIFDRVSRQVCDLLNDPLPFFGRYCGKGPGQPDLFL
jgi:hypothetical protein